MEKEKEKTYFIKDEENLPFKLFLCYSWILIKHEYITKEPIFNLLSNSIEILKLKDKKELSKFYYCNRNKISKILDEEDNFIQIKLNKNNVNMSFYFYLSLVIRNKINKIDYIYSIELIREMNSQRKIVNNGDYNKILISKIILELIDNYRNCDDYEEEKENDELNIIEEENKKIINQNLDNFKKLNLKYDNLEEIKESKIDEIYIELIIGLINNKNFGDNDYTINLFNQLDLENIFLTEIMEKELFKFLEEEKTTTNYNISQLEDLLNNNKLIFFFILFKYLLKNKFYIFGINFLSKIRILINKRIKQGNNNDFVNKYNRIDDNIKKNKIKFVLESFLEEYYLKKLKLDNNNINSNIINDDINNNYDDDNNNEITVIMINMTDNNNNNVNNNINDNNIRNNNENSSYTIISSKYNDIMNPCSATSVKEAHNESNRGLDNNTIENIKMNINIEQMLNDSCFKLKINENVDNRTIEYNEIKIGNKNYKDIRAIKEITFDEKTDTKLLNSYNKFITFLNLLEEKIKNEYNKSSSLVIELKLEKPKNSFDNKKFLDIDCLYKLSNKNEPFRDEDFLNENFLNGLTYLINEMNNIDNID